MVLLIRVLGVDFACDSRICESTLFFWWCVDFADMLFRLARLPHHRGRYPCRRLPPDRHYHVGRRVWFTSDHLHLEARIHACRLDGCLRSLVRLLICYYSQQF